MDAKLTPLAPATLRTDYTTLLALQNLSDYQPSNPTCALPQLLQAAADMSQTEQAELAAQEVLREARRLRIAAGHTFHTLILAAKDQVIAQYGADSLAVSLIGLTRKSDYRWPKQRRKRGNSRTKG
jgi:hypothetical protein